MGPGRGQCHGLRRRPTVRTATTESLVCDDTKRVHVTERGRGTGGSGIEVRGCRPSQRTGVGHDRTPVGPQQHVRRGQIPVCHTRGTERVEHVSNGIDERRDLAGGERTVGVEQATQGPAGYVREDEGDTRRVLDGAERPQQIRVRDLDRPVDLCPQADDHSLVGRVDRSLEHHWALDPVEVGEIHLDGRRPLQHSAERATGQRARHALACPR